MADQSTISLQNYWRQPPISEHHPQIVLTKHYSQNWMKPEYFNPIQHKTKNHLFITHICSLAMMQPCCNTKNPQLTWRIHITSWMYNWNMSWVKFIKVTKTSLASKLCAYYLYLIKVQDTKCMRIRVNTYPIHTLLFIFCNCVQRKNGCFGPMTVQLSRVTNNM